MSAVMKKDGNYELTETRVGPPLGGVLPVSLSSNNSHHIVTGTWYRLMPSGDDADKTSETELALGALLEWFVPCDFNGWYLKILNAGYEEQPPIPIDDIDADGNCKLQNGLCFMTACPTMWSGSSIPICCFS